MGATPTHDVTLGTGNGVQSTQSSSSTHARGVSHQLSTSTTTSGALQVPYPSLEDDDGGEDSEDNENYSTDEDYSKVNSEEAKQKR